jgi:hypothetical protein
LMIIIFIVLCGGAMVGFLVDGPDK